MSTKIPTVKPIFYKKADYEITINPSNTMQYAFDRRGTLLRIQKIFNKINPLLLEYLKPYGKYALQWEISEPQEINGTNNNGNITEGFPRVHLHGILKLTDPIGFLMVGMPHIANNIGTLQINQTFPQDGATYDRKKYWKSYINKQKKLMKPYVEQYGVPYVLSHDTRTKLDNTAKNPITNYCYYDSEE